MKIEEIKKDFPVYKVHPELAYLDAAATTLVPEMVSKAMDSYYTKNGTSVHRGLYPLSNQASEQYEQARKTIAEYIGADATEVIFTSGTTASLNLLARMIEHNINKDGNIVISRLEHHANMIPWQQLAKRSGCELRYIEVTQDGSIDRDSLDTVIDARTQIVSITAISNVTGTIVPYSHIFSYAKQKNSQCITILDAAQLMSYQAIDTKEMHCDFLAFSGHKMYGPKGVGILYGKKESLEMCEPQVFGGHMVDSVTFEEASWAEIPDRFEAGTPNIAGAIGLATAFVYLDHLGWQDIQSHQADLTKYAFHQLSSEATILGPQRGTDRSGIFSFVIPGVHPHDLAELAGQQGVAIRAGHHCAMPLVTSLGYAATSRLSLGLSSTRDDVDRLVRIIQEAKELFS